MTYSEALKQQGIQLGRQEGRQEGIKLGEQKAQQEIAKNLLKSGVDNSVIALATHLTKAQIEELKKSLH